MVTGAEALLHALKAMGVERIYASPGSDWAPLWEALAGDPRAPQYISSRHEETAVGMAIGYAKATGKLPAVVLHTTVGALHATMLVRAALHERIALVVLAGESIAFGEPPAPKVGRQWLRLLTDLGGPARLMESCVKWSFALNTAPGLPHAVQRACQIAMSAPRGPAFVSVPIEYLLQDAEFAAPAAALPALPEVSGEALDSLAAALGAAKKPLIITEEAGREPAAVEALVALAEKLGAPVLEGWQPFYANFPRSHPLYAGVALEEQPPLAKEADHILLVESVLPWHPPSALPSKGVKVSVLGEDPLHPRLPYWGFKADHVLQGNVPVALRSLADRLPSKKSPWISRASAQYPQPSNEKMSTAWVARELNAVLPENAILVDETITHRPDIHRELHRLGPGGYYEASYGGLGGGIGIALGVKHAHPDRIVVVTIGDGAFHYNPVVASFGTAQEHGLPLVVVLFDNAGYLSQKRDVVTHFPKGEAVRTGVFPGTSITPRPDYGALARAYGGVGERVEKADGVRAALKRAVDAVVAGQLAVVHVVLDPA